MENENSLIKIIDGIKSLLNQLPSVAYGPNIIPYFNIVGYGNGQVGFDLLKKEFNQLDLSKTLEYSDLDKKIQRQKEEIQDLEKAHTNLKDILGANIEANEGTIAFQILTNLNKEIDQLIKKRDDLLDEIEIKKDLEDERIKTQKIKEVSQDEYFKNKTFQLEELYKQKEESLNTKFEEDSANINQKILNSINAAERKIKDEESNANIKVKLINQFKDFLEETNKNMSLYSFVILGVLIAAILAISLSIPNLLNIFNSYDTFIKQYSSNITNWQIINFALGLLIVKLPWAFCISAVLTGMYSLLKGLLLTYEKINQDKRNMSAIYAISGNVAQALNEYGISLAEDVENGETGEAFIIIKVLRKGLEQKKENLRWNQIMKYFEGMQQHKVEPTISDDPSKLKLVSGLLNKMIDKLPKT
jgi:hypothetical protein